MSYDDELTRAIRRKIASDEMTALRDATSMNLMTPMEAVRVPLRADVKVAYDRKLATFCVDASVRDPDPNKWLMGRQYFSLREIADAPNKAAIIEYLFEDLKRQFLRKIAEGELERLLNESAAAPSEAP